MAILISTLCVSLTGPLYCVITDQCISVCFCFGVYTHFVLIHCLSVSLSELVYMRVGVCVCHVQYTKTHTFCILSTVLYLPCMPVVGEGEEEKRTLTFEEKKIFAENCHICLWWEWGKVLGKVGL